jgi:hypothetical protein
LTNNRRYAILIPNIEENFTQLGGKESELLMMMATYEENGNPTINQVFKRYSMYYNRAAKTVTVEFKVSHQLVGIFTRKQVENALTEKLDPQGWQLYTEMLKLFNDMEGHILDKYNR